MISEPKKILLILWANTFHFGWSLQSADCNIPGITEPDAASEQLIEFKKRWANKETTANSAFGAPLPTLTTSLTAGPRGPILLQDNVFIEEIAHFNRERIPDRNVHAKGFGAFGYFEVTHDITKFTKAAVFKSIGKRTNIFARFSNVLAEKGSADMQRLPNGFAIKFYTENGIWDLTALNVPVFFIRDPTLFVSLIHSQRRNPVTNLRDPNMMWDFLTLRPESIHLILRLMSDIGIPDGFRHMDAFSINIFKLVNAKGETFWCKFHFKTDQGLKNLTTEAATKLGGIDPDYYGRDLYNAIHKGDHPSWTFYIQVMTMEQGKKLKFNPFDVTNLWPECDFPLIPAGKIVLNKNPTNYYNDVEQSAFGVDHLIPGIEPSPDKILQGRLFAYSDTQRYRLGPNVLQLPINCPFSKAGSIHNLERDGQANYDNQNGAPIYYPNSFYEPIVYPQAKTAPFLVNGIVDRYEDDDENKITFAQAAQFYRSLSVEERCRLVENVATTLRLAKDFIQERAIKNYFGLVDAELCEKLKESLKRKTKL